MKALSILCTALWASAAFSQSHAPEVFSVTGTAEETTHCIAVAENDALAKAQAACSPAQARQLSAWQTNVTMSGSGWGLCYADATATFTCESP